MKNKVKNKGNKEFVYNEEVEDFVGLVFHCPVCNQELHLHIAKIDINKSENIHK